jgi:predicted ArsR family transcriptional regulator
MQKTRRKIIEYLEENRVASAFDLSRNLRMTIANVRHHLGVLNNEKVVELIGKNKSTSRGRPIHLYMLTRKAHNHNLDGLASALMRILFRDRPTKQQDNRLKRLATDLGSLNEADFSGTITQRLYATVLHLDELGYNARWEAHANAPRLILGHCPYMAIIDLHPQLCKMDRHLLERMLEQPVEQIVKFDRNPNSLHYCVFSIGKT